MKLQELQRTLERDIDSAHKALGRVESAVELLEALSQKKSAQRHKSGVKHDSQTEDAARLANILDQYLSPQWPGNKETADRLRQNQVDARKRCEKTKYRIEQLVKDQQCLDAARATAQAARTRRQDLCSRLAESQREMGTTLRQTRDDLLRYVKQLEALTDGE